MSDSLQAKARQIAMDAALAGLNFDEISEKLAAGGCAGAMSGSAIEALMYEAACAKAIAREKRRRLLPRIVGLFAILVGISALTLGLYSEGAPKRRLPIGYGITAVVLGSILVFKPSAGRWKF